MDDLVTYLIVTYDDKTSVAAAERVTHRKCLQETLTFSLEDRGFNVITCTLKSRNSVAASNVPVTVVPRTLRH